MKTRLSLIWFAIFFLLASCQNNIREHNERVILGIFGGMGPEATVDLFRQVVNLTPASKDQDHIPTLVYSLPQVPDRMASIRTLDGKIIPFLEEGVQRLEHAGASFIAIPCNTVHFFYDEMQNAVSIPIIHMIREAALEVQAQHPDIKKVGLLATTGTIESGLYEKELTELGYEVLVPDEEIEMEKVMEAVFGIKAGTDKLNNENLLTEAGQHLIDRGAELLLLGCTEIPLAFNPDRVEVPVVNATKVLAERAITMYREKLGRVP